METTFNKTPISTATTTLVKTGRGKLHTITVGETAAGAISVYDALTETGTAFIVLKASIAEQTFVFDVQFNTGLTIVTAAASKLTVAYD